VWQAWLELLPVQPQGRQPRRALVTQQESAPSRANLAFGVAAERIRVKANPRQDWMFWIWGISSWTLLPTYSKDEG
jgi:hypothetical protein